MFNGTRLTNSPPETSVLRWLKAKLRRVYRVKKPARDPCDHDWQDLDVTVERTADALWIANSGDLQRCSECGETRLKTVVSTTTANTAVDDITLNGTTSTKIEVTD